MSTILAKRARGRPKGSGRNKCALKAPKAELIAALEERIKREPNGCWTFQKPAARNGYSVFYYNKAIQGFAHRVAYEVWVGPIPPNIHVLQRCENKLCCNPAHLYLAQFSTIIQRRDEAGRSISGQRNPKAKLTVEQVLEIRARAQAGESSKDLAAEYNISPPTVSQIKHGTTWKNAQPKAATA